MKAYFLCLVWPLVLIACHHPPAPPTATTGEVAPVPPLLRLPGTARPVSYQARLAITPAEDRFSGAIDIDIELREATMLLWLNGSGLNVAGAYFSAAGQKVPARTVPGGADFLGFRTDRPIGPGAVRLHVDYSGAIADKETHGLFHQQEGGRSYAVSQFEAIYARRVFPCFDEPSFKVPWQLSLEIPEGNVALSNTPVVAEQREHPGHKTVTFGRTRPLPSYLVAFAVGPYELVDAAPGGRRRVPVRVAAPAGKTEQAQAAAQVVPALLGLLEDYFGMPYPYDKLDVVTIPLTVGFGAMENPGLITCVHERLLAPPADQGIEFQRILAEIMAHELAHQWFGDLVTPAWWNDIWLNESFATWMEGKIIDEWKPDWYHHTRQVQVRSQATNADSLITARRVRQPIESNDDIVNAFDGITYSKGAAVLGMFESFLGREAFQRGVRRYLQAHADGNATADDFVGAISTEAGRDIAPAFASFLDQPGVPLLSYRLECGTDGARATLSQERYLPAGSRGSAQERWQVPVCLRYAAGRDTGRACRLLSDPVATFPLDSGPPHCPDWLLGNDGEVGYYRVVYEHGLLARLLREGGGRLSLAERVGLLDDMRALLRDGRLAIADSLALLPDVLRDGRREVVLGTLALLGGVRYNLLPEELGPAYARYLRGLYGTRARALGWTARQTDDEDTRLLRRSLLPLVALEGEDRQLQAEATRLSQRWLSDRKALGADMIGAVLDTAAAHGDRALFERLHEEARKATERLDRDRLLQALGSFREPVLLRAAFDLVMGQEFDPRQAVTILYQGRQVPASRELAYQFVKEHFGELEKRLPPLAMTRLLSVAGDFCDEAHEQDVAAFFKDHAARLPGGPRRLAQALERIGLCAAYVRAQQQSAISFFHRGPSSQTGP